MSVLAVVVSNRGDPAVDAKTLISHALSISALDTETRKHKTVSHLLTNPSS